MAGTSPDLLDPSDLPVRFGRYELLALLGEGGMGRVFRARLEGPEGFRKTLALKVVRSRVAEQQGVRDAIVSEARIGGLLSHPHIVDIYDFGLEGGQPWIAMELVPGDSLADRLQRGPMRPPDVLSLLIALTRGLVHLHGLEVDGASAALVHRDLKPANVLLSEDGRIKITDFGLARAMEGPDAVTWSDAVRGTPAYMSPKQARGQPLDGRSDLFSLGAIGFEAVSGERLLQGGGLIEVMGALMRIEDRLDDVRDLDDVLPGLGSVLVGCLRDEVGNRHADAEELLVQLLELQQRGIQSITQTAPRVRPVRPAAVTSSAALVDVDGVFVGRRNERKRLAELMASGRLVTIVGAGGTGKTRLARRIASERAARFPGGVVFVDLTTASSVDGICHATSQALDVPLVGADPVAGLGAALADRGRCLLLMDNFEQVAAHAGATVKRWLALTSDLTILATSRAVLRLAGERVLRLGPLPTAPSVPRLAGGGVDLDAASGVPAVELFVVRATEANPAFALREDNAADVVALVEALEGIPLAIELAAARARVLSPARILARLPRRFDLLTTGRADVTARQATLRATVDWSWDLLEPWEQAALAQLSVFRGGFSLESAEEVVDLSAWPAAPWVMDVVQALADKSLIRVFEPPGLPGETRFAPYETIREYAADKLARGEPGAVPAIEARHGRHFAELPGPPRAAAAFGRWRRIQALELENLLAAAERAADRGDGEVLEAAGGAALELMLSGGPYTAAERYAAAWRERAQDDTSRIRFGLRLVRAWMSRGRMDEVQALMAELLTEAEASGDALLLIDTLVIRGRLLVGTAEAPSAIETTQRARDLARERRDTRREGEAMGALGTLLSSVSRVMEARQAMEEARRLLRAAGEHEGEVRSLVNLSVIYKELGLDMLLEGTLQEALRRAREINFDRAITVSLLNLAVRWQETGRLNEARDAYLEALALSRKHGNVLTASLLHANLGDLYRELGDLDRAVSHVEQSLEHADGVGERVRSGVLYIRADLQVALGELDAAEETLHQSVALAEASGSEQYRINGLRRLGALCMRRGDLDRAADFLARAREGVQTTVLLAANARIFADSAELARVKEEYEAAEHYLDLADQNARTSDDRIYQAVIACRRAAVARDQGTLDEAREHLAAATHVAAELGLPPSSELARAIADVRVTL